MRKISKCLKFLPEKTLVKLNSYLDNGLSLKDNLEVNTEIYLSEEKVTELEVLYLYNEEFKLFVQRNIFNLTKRTIANYLDIPIETLENLCELSKLTKIPIKVNQHFTGNETIDTESLYDYLAKYHLDTPLEIENNISELTIKDSENMIEVIRYLIDNFCTLVKKSMNLYTNYSKETQDNYIKLYLMIMFYNKNYKNEEIDIIFINYLNSIQLVELPRKSQFNPTTRKSVAYFIGDTLFISEYLLNPNNKIIMEHNDIIPYNEIKFNKTVNITDIFINNSIFIEKKDNPKYERYFSAILYQFSTILTEENLIYLINKMFVES